MLRQLTSLALLGVVTAAWAATEVKHRPDQAAGTPEQIAKGEQLYAMCASCHGAEGEGKVGTAPRLNSPSYLAVVSNDFLKRTFVEGRTGTNMAPFGAGMSPADQDAVVAYMRNWQTKDGVELDESELKGDLKTGEEFYNNICTRCHGRSGAGYSEAGSGTGIGRAAFLDQATNGMLRGIIKQGKDNTAMRSFDEDSPVAVANLTDAEIDSVIKYLRHNAW